MRLHLGKGRASVEHFAVVHVPSTYKDCGAKIIIYLLSCKRSCVKFALFSGNKLNFNLIYFHMNPLKNIQDVPPVLSGMEEYAIPLSHPKNASTKRQRKLCRDLYNLRLLKGLCAVNLYGFPRLTPWSPEVVSKPLAFHEARALYRKHKTLKGYFIHFYIQDDKFECVRKRPEHYIEILKSADFIVAPDFSTYRNYPFPILIKNAFDNLLLAAYFQREGCNVVANVIWARPIFYDLTFSGQPIGGTICISSNSLDIRDKKGVQHWLHGYQEAIKRLIPSQVIRIGKIIPGEEDIFANPIRKEVLNPYVERMRNGR
ncbi:MAG: DUF4417 domain-containing protein [Bacteroides sp.]|nr:DUF4417 domain-containing protein [Bacteroides sp.]